MADPISGPIRHFGDHGVVALVQSFVIGKKSARIDFAQETVSTAVILLDHGRIVHAATPTLRGEEAFFEIGMWTDGTFAVTADEAPAERSIDISTDWLILELLRRADGK